MAILNSLSTISESLLELQANVEPFSFLNSCSCSDCEQAISNTYMAKNITKSVANISDIAKATLDVASQAASAGTFGVGGILIDNLTGEIIHSMRNRVIEKLHYTNSSGVKIQGASFPLDPTNHGERQMVSWYYENRGILNLKAPQDYTIATSLDPCAMCSGSLITAGFNVAVIAPDPEAGTNWTDLADYPQLDYRLKTKLSEKFGYYGVSIPAGPRSIYQGSKNLIFSDQKLSNELYDANINVFKKDLKEVRASVSGSGLEKGQMLNPKLLPTTSTIRTSLQEADPDALSLILSNPFAEGSGYYKPNETLYRLLRQRMEAEQKLDPRVSNAVALIDPFGNLLMIGTDKYIRQLPSGEKYEDPINTAFMSLIQKYSALRYELISDISLQSNSKDAYKNSDEFKALTSPKYLTFVFLKGLSPGATTTLKDLGAYGSSMEGKVEIGNFQFIEPPAQGNSKQFMEQIRSLPPLYGSYNFNLMPTQTPVESLDIKVTSLADSGENTFRQAIELANRDKVYRRILISTPGTIKLNSDLPEVTQAVAIVGPLNASSPTVALNANGHSGIKLSSTAIGTSIENLIIHGASGKGIELSGGWKVWNNSISVVNTILGKNINGDMDLNRGGGITELSLGVDHNLEGWGDDILGYDNYNLSNNLQVTSNIAGVIMRHDTGNQAGVKIIFEQANAAASLVGGRVEIADLKAAVTDAFSPLVVSPGFLLTKGTDSYASYLSSEGKSQGSSKDVNLSSGTYNVYALDSDGRRYALRELRSGSNGIVMRLHHEDSAFLAPDGKPISISISLPSSGTNSILQTGEASLRISRLAAFNNLLAFYPVTDPLTGMVTLDGKNYNPGDAKYLSSALQLAKNYDLITNPNSMPSYQDSANIVLKNLNPSVPHGLLLMVNGSEQNLFSSFSAANPGGASQFMSIATGDGSLMFGVEDLLSTSKESDRDFNDLLVQFTGYKLTGT